MNATLLQAAPRLELPDILFESPAISQSTDSAGLASDSDDAMAARVRRRLTGTGYIPLRRILISATPAGNVRLEGTVSSFYLKQVAQTAALAVVGVASVRNELQVCR